MLCVGVQIDVDSDNGSRRRRSRPSLLGWRNIPERRMLRMLLIILIIFVKIGTGKACPYPRFSRPTMHDARSYFALAGLKMTW